MPPPRLLPRQNSLTPDKPPLPPPKKLAERRKERFNNSTNDEDEDGFQERREAFKKRRAGDDDGGEVTSNATKSVKDLARSFNDIAEKEEDIHGVNSETLARLRHRRKFSVAAASEDVVSIGSGGGGSNVFVPHTKEEKQWIMAATRNDLFQLRQLLSKHGGRALIGVRDHWSGYTALHWAAKGLWDFQTADLVNLETGLAAAGTTDLRARTETGITVRTINGVTLGFEGFYDGIGASNYDAYGGSAKVAIPLN